MRHVLMPDNGNPLVSWLIFGSFLLLVCVAVGGFVVWLKMGRHSKGKHRRKRHRHHRHTNPTLAESGGLPPKRSPDQPPPGP